MPTCRVCGTEMHGSICLRCIERQKTGSQLSGPEKDTSSIESTSEHSASDDEDYDPLTRVASEQSLAEKLLTDMAVVLPEADLSIAEYLVGSLDDRGYLAARIEDVAFDLDADVDRVRAGAESQSEDPMTVTRQVVNAG